MYGFIMCGILIEARDCFLLLDNEDVSGAQGDGNSQVAPHCVEENGTRVPTE